MKNLFKAVMFFQPVVQVSNMAYSYDQMQTDLECLKQLYPGRISTWSRGVTADGREITEVVLGQKDAPVHILIQSSIHAREYINTILTMNQIEDFLHFYYERSYGGYLWSDLYKNVCFHVLPMVNPDGVTVSQMGPEGIRDREIRAGLIQCFDSDCINGKTNRDMEAYFRKWKANARGVDLNRNFDAGWEAYTGAGAPSLEGYKGDKPFSEPETRAILNLARKYSLSCCVCYHSSGNLVYWNYGSTGKVLEEDAKLAECVGKVTRYKLCSTIRYAADSAGCSDYFVQNLGIPAVTIENGAAVCPLSAEEYQPIYEKNKDLWPALAFLYMQKEDFAC